jgi:hypothetical protein
MIVRTWDADPRGRPVIEPFVAASVPRVAALEASGESPPSPVLVPALVDIGASRTNVQKSILDRLGLEPVAEEWVHTASTGGTPIEVRAYAVQLLLAGVPAGRLAADLRVVEAEDLRALGVELLLGRDVLDHCLQVFNGPERRFTVAFPPTDTLP